MIIKKKNFNLTPGFRGKWPFTVPEITILKMTVGEEGNKLDAFAVIHNFGAFALSGVLEGYGFHKLETAGIWAKDRCAVVDNNGLQRKSLTPFFEYLKRRLAHDQ